MYNAPQETLSGPLNIHEVYAPVIITLLGLEAMRFSALSARNNSTMYTAEDLDASFSSFLTLSWNT